MNNINSQAECTVEQGVDGEWDVSRERNATFTLTSHVYISNLVKTIFSWQFELFLHYDTILTRFCSIFYIWMIRYSLLTNECPELPGLFWKLICTYHIHVIGNTVTSYILNVWFLDFEPLFALGLRFSPPLLMMPSPNRFASQYLWIVWTILKFVNQSRFQGFCGSNWISRVHKLKILHFWDFYPFSALFSGNMSPKWCLSRALLFIQPISISELSEVDFKSKVELLIVSKILGGLNHWK